MTQILVAERRKYVTSYDQKFDEAKALSELSHDDLLTVARNMEDRNEVLYAENQLLRQILFGSDEYNNRKPGLMDAIKLEG